MDKLHFIVQSFSQEESTGFEHFVNRLRSKSERLDLKLFQRLRLPEKLNLPEAYQILYNNQPEREAYHALRKRLLGHVIDFLEIKTASTDRGNRNYSSEGLLLLTRYLFSKGAFAPGWVYFKRALDSELKKQDATVLADIYLLWLENWSDYQGEESFNQIYKQYQHYQSLKDLQTRIKLAHSIIKRKLDQKRNLLIDIQIDQVVKEVTKDLELSKKEYYQWDVLIELFNSLNDQIVTKEDAQIIADFFSNRFQKILKKHTEPITDHAFYLLQFKHAKALFQLSEYEACYQLLDGIDWLLSDGLKSEVEDLLMLVQIFKWQCCFYLGKTDESLKVIQVAYRMFEHRHHLDLLDFKLFEIWTYFTMDQIEKSKEFIEQIGHSLNFLQKKKGFEWCTTFLLLEAIVYYELGDKSTYKKNIKQLQKLLKDHSKEFPIRKVILEQLQDLESNRNFSSQLVHFTLENNINKDQINSIICFGSYLKSKADQQPYKEALIELIQNK